MPLTYKIQDVLNIMFSLVDEYQNDDDSSNSVPTLDAVISVNSNTIIEMEEESELHKSIRNENIEETEKLLQNNKDLDDVNRENKDGETPFYLAAGSEKGIM